MKCDIPHKIMWQNVMMKTASTVMRQKNYGAISFRTFLHLHCSYLVLSSRRLHSLNWFPLSILLSVDKTMIGQKESKSYILTLYVRYYSTIFNQFAIILLLVNEWYYCAYSGHSVYSGLFKRPTNCHRTGYVKLTTNPSRKHTYLMAAGMAIYFC